MAEMRRMVGWNLGDWAYRVAEAEQLPGGRKASSIERAAADWAPPGELPATPVSGKNTHLGNTHSKGLRPRPPTPKKNHAFCERNVV